MFGKATVLRAVIGKLFNQALGAFVQSCSNVLREDQRAATGWDFSDFAIIPAWYGGRDLRRADGRHGQKETCMLANDSDGIGSDAELLLHRDATIICCRCYLLFRSVLRLTCASNNDFRHISTVT